MQKSLDRKDGIYDLTTGFIALSPLINGPVSVANGDRVKLNVDFKGSQALTIGDGGELFAPWLAAPHDAASSFTINNAVVNLLGFSGRGGAASNYSLGTQSYIIPNDFIGPILHDFLAEGQSVTFGGYQAIYDVQSIAVSPHTYPYIQFLAEGSNVTITTSPPPAPTVASKIFGLIVGLFSAGTTEQPGKVDGASDANNVYRALSTASSGQWASASAGNTTNSVSLTLDSTDGKQQIKTALDAMQVSAGDTVFFYYSGHGQSFASVGGHDEAPVSNVEKYPSGANTSDETIQLGALYDLNTTHSDRYLSDDELAALFKNDPKWVGVRKIFIIDACYGGGFWQTGLSSDFGDLNKLDNTYFLAAAPETMRAHTVTDGSGLGLWTEKAFLPALSHLGVNSTWEILQQEIDKNIADWNRNPGFDINGVSYAKDGGIYDPAIGFQLISGFSANTSDFNMNAPLFEAHVPEPGTYTMLLAGLGLLGWLTKRSKRTQLSN